MIPSAQKCQTQRGDGWMPVMLSTWGQQREETGGSGVQGQLGLCSGFETRLGSLKSCLTHTQFLFFGQYVSGVRACFIVFLG